MKRSKFTEAQIVAILNEGERGVAVKDICRKHGISDATFYNWKARYGGLGGLGVEAAERPRG
jgi:putative transposase